VNQGSSTMWNVLLPTPAIDNGDNRVRPNEDYGFLLPFTGEPGDEKLFVVFSRTKEPDLESLIHRLKTGQKAVEEPSAPKVMVASAAIDDSVVTRLRDAYSRDLAIEKIDDDKSEDQPGPKGTAVYVVNPNGSAEARVVADITLHHSGEKLTARQMFYATRQEPPAKAKAKPATIAARRPAAGAPAPPTLEAEARPASIVPVAYTASAAAPLGLRYTLSKKTDEGTVIVSPADTFHTGESIAINLEVNDAGYLYMVNQGSSGNWLVLLPSRKIDNGDNSVHPNKTYSYRLRFTGDPGVERLFVIFSRTEEPDLERLIYSLKGGKVAPASTPRKTPKGTPAEETPIEEPAPKTMLASLTPIDDAVVDRLREVYSRDLDIETVDNDQSEGHSGPKGTAVYVVNPKGSPDSRVVADISLRHE